MGNAYSDVKDSDSELESDSDEEVVKRTPDDSDWTYALKKKIDHIERMVISGSEFSSGLEENNQFIQYDNRDTYEGPIVNGQKNGKGIMMYVDGNKYIGKWKDDKREGFGKMTYTDNGVYHGEYIGEWKNDKKNGKGRLIDEDSIIYEGIWENGVLNGKCTITENGDVYDGDVVDYIKKGKGTMIYANKDKYYGDWNHNMKNGMGIMKYVNGDLYEGNFEDDQKSTFGRMTYTNGDVYIGNWEDDEKMSDMTFENGIYKGKTLDEKDRDDGMIKYTNGDVYIGIYDENYGKNGIMKYVNGDEYIGQWKDDKKNGLGIMKYANGNLFIGLWTNNKKHDTRDIIFKGIKFVGDFLDGHLDNITQIDNPDNIVLQPSDILTNPQFITTSRYPIEFYKLFGLVQETGKGTEYNRIKEKMFTNTGPVILACICHGGLPKPPIPIEIRVGHSIRRIGYPMGVCGFSDIKNIMKHINLFTNKKISLIQKIMDGKLMLNSQIKNLCDSTIKDEYAYKEQLTKTVNACSLSKESVDRVFTSTGEFKHIVNKNFSLRGDSINVVLLIDEKGEYINLLSEKSDVTLDEILSGYIPNCTNLLYIDHSCGDNSNGLYDEDVLARLGGKRKTKRKRKKSKRVYKR